MSSRRVHRTAVVAVALLVAGCSSTGTEGPTSLPGQQAPSKAAQAAAEEHNREQAHTAQQDRRAELGAATQAKLAQAQATATKLNEAAQTRLNEERATQAEHETRLNEAASTRLGAVSTP